MMESSSSADGLVRTPGLCSIREAHCSKALLAEVTKQLLLNTLIQRELAIKLFGSEEAITTILRKVEERGAWV